MKKSLILIAAVVAVVMSSCNSKKKETDSCNMGDKVAQYKSVELKADLSWLPAEEKEIIVILIEAADVMDDIFWMEAYGDKKALLEGIECGSTKRFAEINYGPWDRLDGNKSFVEGIGEKPAGANFYPVDMTKEEFESLEDTNKLSLYTVIRRDESGKLIVVPYSVAYKAQYEKVATLLRQAAALSKNESFANYLNLRAEALLTDNYRASDMAWMDMKTSNIDFIVGPIENYEDKLYGAKAAHEAFILIKDLEWSKKLEKFVALLPELQKGLPVEEKYKKEMPGLESDMNVYEAIYYAGDCNAGSKTIAINLPNDEVVQLQKGSRKLQLKNSMKAKFDNILVPISNILIDETQRKYISFDAFFENTTFHEVSHGMGIKNTINGKGTVKDALKEQYSAIEEAKADILGLHLVTKLYEMGELSSGEVMNNYVTFLAGIFRSVRFGAASAHGKANMLRFYYFQETGAFTRNDNGTYAVNFEKMKESVVSSVQQILTIQGDGDYNKAKALIEKDGLIKDELQKDLNRISEAKIPVDIVFEKGKHLLGL
jgi:hypothetical protein